jgi:hypothetical protein
MTQPPPAVKTWIPVDVKIHWFSFLSAEDLSRASRVCKPWASLVQKTSEVLVATTIGASCPNLSRAGKLLLLRRLQNATKKENMGYLLAWAAGCRGEWGGGTALKCLGTTFQGLYAAGNTRFFFHYHNTYTPAPPPRTPFLHL